MTGRDTEDALPRLHGIKPPEDERESKLKPIDCSVCDSRNPATAKFCNRCGKVLSVEAALEMEDEKAIDDSVMSKLLLNDPEIQKATQSERVLRKSLRPFKARALCDSLFFRSKPISANV